ncbi:MAG TPA: endonuclease [Myxococcaceae bacterium]|jgi:endonuclease I/V8-like Glu-specific endopeptidase
MGFVKNDGMPRSQDVAELPPPETAPARGNGQGSPLQRPISTAGSRTSARLANDWFQRVRSQLDRTEQRYQERREPRRSVVHQLRDEHRSPLEVDSPERVHARLRRLGIERTARGEPGTDTARMRTQVVPCTAEPTQLVYERVLGRSDLTSVCFLERGLKVSRTVGRIHIGDSRGRVSGYGTGFMVSPRLMLTNHHVLSSKAEAATSRVEFNYQAGWDGAALPSVVFALEPGDFFLTDETLDYTLVAVRPVSLNDMPLSEFGFNRLDGSQGKVLLGEYVNIIQHPNGEPKQLALRENQVVDVLDNFLHYMTDTAPGSSGSPVFNDQWEVVALHHMGIPKRNEHGDLLTLEGTVWEPGADPALLAFKANEGTRVSTLLKHVRAQSLSGEARKLRAELLEPKAHSEEPEPPRSGSRKRPSTASARMGRKGSRARSKEAMVPEAREGKEREAEVSPAAAEQEPGLVTGQMTLADGGTTLTVPLRVNIQVNLAELAAVRSEGARESALFRPGLEVAARPVKKEGFSAREQMERQLEEALKELKRARRRPYFDEEASRLARERYYADLGEEPDFAALSERVTGTHRTILRYAPMRHVYPVVDLRPNGMLRSIYSGKEFDPEEFIREDARIDRARADRFREVVLAERELGAEAMAAELALLEVALPFNCEHVVPQSWFGKREPMRGDLHHLFACESGCNSFRGNTPYFDFPDFEEALREDCGKRLGNKFEPTSGKGAVARATLYFLLRYPGEINRLSTEYEERRLSLLLRWHAEDPPDVYEHHRNEAIYERQGNRNPLIDHPEWAQWVDFSEGLG